MNLELVFGRLCENVEQVSLQFVGTGSAFCLDNWQSNALLTVKSQESTKRLLIDCGGDARHALSEAGYSYLDVDAVYISHAHADHAGGLEWMAFARHFDPRSQRKPILVGNHRVLDEVWDGSIKGGLSSLEGVEATLDTYFDVRSLADNQYFQFNGVKIELLRVIHTMNNREFMPSYGLMIHTPDGQKVFFTTDAQHAPSQISHFYDRADIIFHDCETLYLPNTNLEPPTPDITKPIMSGVHAHLEELKDLPEETRAKMWLYHYQDGTIKYLDERPRELGFRGFVKKGQTFTWPN